jgi:hypothetical protein
MSTDSGQRRVSLMRVAVWLATTSLSLGMVLPAAAPPAYAQPAPPPGSADQGAELAGQENTDPPPIAGSLATISGSVSFHAAGETNWTAATLNYPVTNGEGFWTEKQASATIDVADDSLVLDESTEFDVTTLDQSRFVTTLAQGAIFVHLNSVAQGQTLTVNTPRGAVTISQAGRYEIVAGDTDDATMVTVVEGAAHVSGTGVELDIGPQQTATIGGTDTFSGSVGPMQQDAFLQAQLRVVLRTRTYATVPRQVQYMTGGAELASYGTFTQTQQYGQVWYPSNVASTWAPYRDGHWAYVQPWGWTWVDNARWGFAPFHYGRWVQVDNRWGWIAGEEAAERSGGAYASYPVYSPALVAFVGVGAGSVGFSVGIGGGGYAPAWVPLGPREPYYPWYHCRQDYFARVNNPYGVPRTIIERGPTYINNVTNIRQTNINIHQTNVYINQRAATAIPAAAFARGEAVQRNFRPVPERAFAEAQPMIGRLPVRPTAYTPNLPRVAAERYHVTLPARPVQAVAAGPRIVPVVQGARAVPELRRAALPANTRAVPASQVRPGEPALRPGAAVQPGLRAGETPRPGEAARPALRVGGAPEREGTRAEHGVAAVPTQAGRPPAIAPHAATPEARGAELRGPREHMPEHAPEHAAEPPHYAPAVRGEAARPQLAHGPARGEAPREPAHAEAPRERPAAPHAEAARPAEHVEAARREEPRHEAPRREEPRLEAPRREEPRHEAPRREEARPAAHAEAPHPAAHGEAHHPGEKKEPKR